MNGKVKMVVVAVLASLSCGVSVAHAGFSETPYISYLSAEEFDAVVLPPKLDTQARVPESVSAIRAAESGRQSAAAEEKVESATSVTSATNTLPSTGCAAEEAGYIAPCI